MGKAIGGGVPIGAIIARDELIPDGLEREHWHIQTFMNQPLAAAAGIAVLDVIEDEGLVERADTLGAEATSRFRELAERYETIGDVRGPGLFVGIDFVVDRDTKEPASEAVRKRGSSPSSAGSSSTSAAAPATSSSSSRR